MGFIKYQKAEKVENVSQSEHDAIRDAVAKTGKVSAKDLTEEERETLPKL